ncbi:MAG TPA: hypothetical protein VM364_15960 [Vicinamibacterales bacterium]|nr:hypothetical protein [Vicinamibacterales bacterium]
MNPRRAVVASLVLGLLSTSGGSSARQPTALDLLGRYAAGAFDAVARQLADDVDYGELLRQLRRDGPAWIDSGAPDERPRRELAAATFALEAARAGAWHEWKIIRKQPLMCAENGECYLPPDVLAWQAPPLLLEWGCALLRAREQPLPIERWWQLAAVAVAQRAEDPHFLIGDPNVGRGIEAGEIVNRQDEIRHLDHATGRFPDEMRFVLAQGIARDGPFPDEAVTVYRALEHHPDVGGEAMARLGAMQARQRKPAEALKSLERSEALTRDPYVIFLARYFRARVLEQQGRHRDAEAAYRGAAAALPHAQSATVALAALVFRDGRRSEAHELVRGMLAAEPRPIDPWRAYVHADDRFWPRLIQRLRAEIAP